MAASLARASCVPIAVLLLTLTQSNCADTVAPAAVNLQFTKSAPTADPYAFFDLGAGPGPAAINNVGAVLGLRNPLTNLPAIWENGALRDLALLPGTQNCFPEDINDQGVVVGHCMNTTVIRAVMWDAQGAVQEVPNGRFARGINESGMVVGRVNATGVTWQGAQVDTMGAWIWPSDLNESGQSSAIFFTGNPQYPLLWSPGTGVQMLYSNGEANALNDAGTVVGYAQPGSGPETVAFRVPQGGFIEFLGTLGGHSSAAFGINSAGDIVGRSETLSVKPARYECCSGFVWTESAGMKKLPVPKGRSVSWATDINDAGWIVGHVSVLGADHIALWKPTI